MKEYKKAVEYYSQAIAENPSMSRPNPPPKDRFFLTIDSQVELKACDEYGKTHPSDPYALAIQALLQEEVGVSDGVELFSKSIALKKDLLFTRIFRFESLGGQHMDEDTQIALRLAPTNPRAMVNRGIYYCEMHEFDKAQAMFDRAQKTTGPWARIYSNEGRLASFQGDYDRCVARYTLARELEPGSQFVYLQAVEALLKSHRHSEALAWLDDAAKEGIDSHEIRSLRCRAYQADGNYFGVIAERLKDPENSLPLFILITSLALLGYLALIPVSSLAASKW